MYLVLVDVMDKSLDRFPQKIQFLSLCPHVVFKERLWFFNHLSLFIDLLYPIYAVKCSMRQFNPSFYGLGMIFWHIRFFS